MLTCPQCGSEIESPGQLCSKCGVALPEHRRRRIRVRKRRRVPIMFYAEGGPNWTMITFAVVISVLLALWLLYHLNKVERVPPALTGSAAAPAALNNACHSGSLWEGFRELRAVAELGQPRSERA